MVGKRHIREKKLKRRRKDGEKKWTQENESYLNRKIQLFNILYHIILSTQFYFIFKKEIVKFFQVCTIIKFISFFFHRWLCPSELLGGQVSPFSSTIIIKKKNFTFCFDKDSYYHLSNIIYWTIINKFWENILYLCQYDSTHNKV